MATAPAPDVIERVTSYIKHQGTKSPEALRDMIQTAHDRLVSLLDSMSAEQASFKPGAEDWSALELMHHVVSAKAGVARACERLAKGEVIPSQGGEGDGQDGMMRGEPFTSKGDARSAVEAAHGEMLSFLEHSLPKANLEVRFHHFLFGDLNCAEWAAFQRVHDGDHANQIEQIKAAPGYPP
jgi:hypothetical protein